MERIYAYLDGLGIRYRRLDHAPTDTMQACAEVDRALGTLTPKNLFVTTRHGGRFYLCLMRPEARFVTSQISRQAGTARLCFASEEALMQRLHCRPGSASPLGLVFEEAAGVGLIVDRRLMDCPSLGFHPCDSGVTLAMSGEDFFGRFLVSLGVEPMVVEAGGSGD